MTKQDLLPYCLFYKGEESMPSRFVDDIRKAVTSEGLLWRAEKFVCEEANSQINKENPRYDIMRWVDSFVGKWNPYGYDEVMSHYSKSARKH